VAEAPPLRAAAPPDAPSGELPPPLHSLALVDGRPDLARRLREMVQRHPLLDRVPLVLFLDDLGGWDAGSLDLVLAAVAALGRLPVWAVATWRDEEGGEPPLAGLGPVDEVALPRLDDRQVEQLAAGLVGAEEAGALARRLREPGGTLPLRASELLHELWETGSLFPGQHGGWRFVESPEGVRAAGAERPLRELLGGRLHRLPASARDLLALGAVLGPTFEVDLLETAAEEHHRVVEIALEVAIEQGFLRRFQHHWRERPGPRDLLLWTGGARRGRVQFCHDQVHRLTYESLEAEERRALHRRVALHLEAAPAADDDEDDVRAASLARHWLAAGDPGRARPWLEACRRRAEAVGDAWTAERCRRLAAG
jgi:predicted ATPase